MTLAYKIERICIKVLRHRDTHRRSRNAFRLHACLGSRGWGRGREFCWQPDRINARYNPQWRHTARAVAIEKLSQLEIERRKERESERDRERVRNSFTRRSEWHPQGSCCCCCWWLRHVDCGTRTAAGRQANPRQGRHGTAFGWGVWKFHWEKRMLAA